MPGGNLIFGRAPSGNVKPLLCDADGNLKTAPAGSASAETVLVPTTLTTPVVTPGTPVVLAADGTFFHNALVKAQKATRGANTGNVYLGGAGAGGTQPLTMAPGDEINLQAQPGYKLDLNDFLVDAANAADAVTILYW